MRGVALSAAVSAEHIIESEHASQLLACPSHTFRNIPICGANFVRFIPSELMFFTRNLQFSPPFDWVTRFVLPGVKRSGSEADHSRSFRVEVKNDWIYTSTPCDEIKDNYMDGACGTYVTQEGCALGNGG